jgi:hypothetical protein
MRRGRIVVVAASVATMLGAALGVALSDGGGTTQAGDPLAGQRAQRVDAGIAPQASHGCGALPHAFENPVAGYQLCYPAGWGFLDLTQAFPDTTIDGVEAASLRLASAATFPWRPGTLPLDAVSRGAIIVELTTLPTFAPDTDNGDCRPDRRLGGGAQVCEHTVDPMSASPSETGSVLEIMTIHELETSVAVVRTYLDPDDGDRATVLLVLDTLRPLGSGR